MVAGLGKLSCFNLCLLLSFVRCPSLCSQCAQCVYYAAGEQTVTEYFKQVLNKIKVHVTRVGEQGKHQKGMFNVPFHPDNFRFATSTRGSRSAPAETAKWCGPMSPSLHPSQPGVMPIAGRVSAKQNPLLGAPHHKHTPTACPQCLIPFSHYYSILTKAFGDGGHREGASHFQRDWLMKKIFYYWVIAPHFA